MCFCHRRFLFFYLTLASGFVDTLLHMLLPRSILVWYWLRLEFRFVFIHGPIPELLHLGYFLLTWLGNIHFVDVFAIGSNLLCLLSFSFFFLFSLFFDSKDATGLLQLIDYLFNAASVRVRVSNWSEGWEQFFSVPICLDSWSQIHFLSFHIFRSSLFVFHCMLSNICPSYRLIECSKLF